VADGLAEHADFFPPSAAMHLEAELKALGKDASITVHEGSGHAFMAPHNALGTQDQDLYDLIWPQVTAFLHDKLG
ncbi:MAG: dienelactone hydrolase family protein, partial [Ilumatobacter sp.]|nr:dienelactone hydrolase family protein [Ilumatobacter sp.]